MLYLSSPPGIRVAQPPSNRMDTMVTAQANRPGGGHTRCVESERSNRVVERMRVFIPCTPDPLSFRFPVDSIRNPSSHMPGHCQTASTRAEPVECCQRRNEPWRTRIALYGGIRPAAPARRREPAVSTALALVRLAWSDGSHSLRRGPAPWFQTGRLGGRVESSVSIWRRRSNRHNRCRRSRGRERGWFG